MANYTYNAGDTFDDGDYSNTADHWTVNGTSANAVQADGWDLFQSTSDTGNDNLTATYFNFRSFYFRGGNDYASITNSSTTNWARNLYMGHGVDTVVLNNAYVSDVELANSATSTTETSADKITSTNSSIGYINGGYGDDTIHLTSTTLRNTATSIDAGGDKDTVTLIDVDTEGDIQLGAGDDTLTISAASDIDGNIYGGTGNDTITVTNSNVENSIDTGTGNDTVTLNNATGIDDISMGDGNDTLDATSSIVNGAINMGNGVNDVDLVGVTGIDSLTTGSGIDTVDLTNTSISGTVSTDAGADIINITNSSIDATIISGDGDDVLTIDGLTDLDQIWTEAGDDTVTISNSSISDDIELGTGNDTIIATNTIVRDIQGDDGSDYILIENGTMTGQVTGDGLGATSGGAGDTIIVNNSTVDDSIYGGGGTDTIQLNNVTDLDSVIGGTGNDTIYVANSTLSADIAGDVIGAGSGFNHGDDTITVYNTSASWIAGGGGDDDIFVHSSTARNDIWGGDGDDTIDVFNSSVNGIVAEGGADTIILHDVILTGTNDIEGNAGSDQVYFDNVTRIDGSDYVKTWGGEDFGAVDTDYLYISVPVDANGDIDYAYIRANLEFTLWWEGGSGTEPDDYNGTVITNLGTLANGYDDGVGLLYTGDDLAGTFVTQDGLTIEFDQYEGLIFIPEVADPEIPDPVIDLTCFVRGAMIDTENGPIAIEDLKLGDMIKTRDNGYQPLKWVGSSLADATDKHAPIKFAKGAIGNSEELMFSPQHRILVSSVMNEILLGDCDVLVPAKHFVNGEDVTIAYSETKVEYFHIMFDCHETVMSSGTWSESFQPSDKNIRSFDCETRDEILELFPMLRDKTCETSFESSHYSTNAHESSVVISMFTGAN